MKMNMKTFGYLTLMAAICIVLFWVFMALRPANASWRLVPGDTTDRLFHGCGSSWTICRARAVNRAYIQARPSKESHRVGCDALCQAKCDATSVNPAACYVKWNRLNLAGKGRECEKTLGRGPNCK
jgi:hypothetical protein